MDAPPRPSVGSRRKRACFLWRSHPKEVTLQPEYLIKQDMNTDDIKLIAFDADDTLWDCQSHFDEAERQYCAILSPWAAAEEVSESLFRTESANMPLLGYGCKAFTLSLVENAVSVSHGQITGNDIARITALGKSLLTFDTTPLPGVETTLRALYAARRWPLVVFTKGELLDQQLKLRRSGLEAFFDGCTIVSDKTPEAYHELCRSHGTDISNLLMVGNSFKSDIAPVLQLGGRAVHIPFEKEWRHESATPFPHERLATVKAFSELTALLLD